MHPNEFAKNVEIIFLNKKIDRSAIISMKKHKIDINYANGNIIKMIVIENLKVNLRKSPKKKIHRAH